MTPDQIDQFKKRLLLQLEEARTLQQARAQAAGETGMDQCIPGRVNEESVEGHALMLNLAKRAGQTSKEIEAALRRCADGSFGECLHCGEAIAPARLNADPRQALCITCAAAKEI